jgi:hypothetical protein
MVRRIMTETGMRMHLRVSALRALHKWAGECDCATVTSHQQQLADLLGYESYTLLKAQHESSPELSRKLEMLAGPNGWAIYKTMLARQSK